MDDIFLA